jgi:nitroreductase
METAIQAESYNGKETIRTIYERRAVRKYKNKVVEWKLIEQIIGAGRMAPSAINKQPWKFYVVTDKMLIKSFSAAIAGITIKDFAKSGIKKMFETAAHLFHFSKSFSFSALEDPVFHGAPVVIFITSPKDNEWASLDIGMCAQNMMLAAKSLGLDTCPVGFGKYIEKTKIFPRLRIPN